ncbi:MAG: FAD-dependent oxidoreductase [Solirubrobacteraceae bacterium]|nr:FAD-dependent oxidoreductase [Solirubrobacteraceae bacterium]
MHRTDTPEAAAHRPAPGAWHARAPLRRPRAPLRSDLEVDVAIVGGGFSGLWTAYHLLQGDPSLRVVVLERDVIGFGASGRNGGWLMGAAPADLQVWERKFGLDAARRAQGVLVDAVSEIADVIARDELGLPPRLAGSITIARSAAEEQRLHARRAADEHYGWPADGHAWLEPDEVRERIGATGVRGALESRPCGTLDPVRLITKLAARVEALGGTVHERSPVVSVEPRLLRTDSATVRAPRIVMATEAFTVEQPGEGRRYLPLASTIVSTAPIPDGARDEIGWRGGEAVGDAHHLFFYAQITREGRLTLGGRGAPYRLGSAVEHAGIADRATTDRLEATIADVWPALAGVPIESRWSGSIAVPRDWCASCGVDADSGVAWIGGYGGHGVAATYVLARSLAPLLRGEPDPLGPLPWTLHRPRRWEPEPIRWMMSQAIVRTLGSADRLEAAGKPARRMKLVERFIAG